MDVTLVLVRESGVANTVKMRRSRLVIGRRPECEIRIPVPQVSREHAEITLENDELTIKDLGSSNGTYVDGQRVQQATLAAGSVLTIGPATFAVQVDGQPEDIDVAAILKKGAVAASVANEATPPRPAAPAKPATSSSNQAPKPGAKPAAPKPLVSKKDPDDSDLDLDADLEGSSFGDIDFSDLLKDDDDENEQPKL